MLITLFSLPIFKFLRMNIVLRRSDNIFLRVLYLSVMVRQRIKNEIVRFVRGSIVGERGLIGILIVVPGERPVPECLYELSRGCNTQAILLRPPTNPSPPLPPPLPPPLKRNETLQENPFFKPFPLLAPFSFFSSRQHSKGLLP